MTILVADDETHILNVIAIKLRNAGYRVITAQDGVAAYELARIARPDLMITDYYMPRLSGLELCSRLQCDPLTRHVPVILLTAGGSGLPELHRLAGNISKVIPKPFSLLDLLESVESLLAQAGRTCG